jgi:anti-anti-sigma factor
MTNKVHFKKNVDSKKSHISITLGGELTLSNSKKLAENLQESTKPYSEIEITIDDVEAIDISCIQLLYALRKDCETQNKKCSIIANLSETNMELLTTAGFNFSII